MCSYRMLDALTDYLASEGVPYDRARAVADAYLTMGIDCLYHLQKQWSDEPADYGDRLHDLLTDWEKKDDTE